jgi:hypothetical protein
MAGIDGNLTLENPSRDFSSHHQKTPDKLSPDLGMVQVMSPLNKIINKDSY